MAYTEFAITKGPGAMDTAGGGPHFGPSALTVPDGVDDGPVVARANTSSGGGGTQITNDGGDGWGNAAVNDFLCFDTGGAKDRARITNIADQVLTVTPAVTNGLNTKNTNVGGAWQNPSIIDAFLDPTVFTNAAGDPTRLNIQAGSAYIGGFSQVHDGAMATPLFLEGFTSTFGDDGEAELGDLILLVKFARARRLYATPTGIAVNGFSVSIDCTAELCRANPTGAGSHGFALVGGGAKAIGCISPGATVHNFWLNAAGASAINCSGFSAGVSAFACGSQADNSARILYAIGYGSGGHIFSLTQNTLLMHSVGMASAGGSGVSATANPQKMATVLSCILYGNAQYGIEKPVAGDVFEDYNAIGGNGGGAYQNVLIPGANDVGLSGDPFVDAANDDFNLDLRTAPGLACLNAGYPANTSIGAIEPVHVPLRVPSLGGVG